MELQDYSGEFRPDLRMEDLSKDALIRLLRIAVRGFLGLDRTWHSLVREKYGSQAAADFSKEVWTKRDSPVLVQDMRQLLPAFNIRGDDIATVFKYLQLNLMIGIYYYKLDFQLKDENYGILSVTYCPPLDFFEKRGDAEGAKFACGMDVPWLENVAAHFNPKIRVKPLKEIPRKSKDEVPCQWEFRLVE